METHEETALLLDAEAEELIDAAIRLREHAARLRGHAIAPGERQAAREGLTPRAEVRLARARDRTRQRAAAIYLAFRELQTDDVEA